jgi:hypothetical protein
MRVYLPATLRRLQAWLDAGQAVTEVAYAVTPSLREWYREAELDELEHAAQQDAAIGSLTLLAADPDGPPRRVVLAVELPDSDIRPASGVGRAVVTLPGPVPIARWASALVDDLDAAATVVAAVAAVGPAAAGDDDAQFALDEAEAHELGWYAVQELPFLLGPG